MSHRRQRLISAAIEPTLSIKSEDPGVRKRAIRAAPGQSERDRLRILDVGFADPDPRVRREAAEIAGIDPPLGESCVEQLSNQVASDQDAVCREAAAFAIGECGSPHEARRLFGLIGDDDSPLVREAIFAAIGAIAARHPKALDSHVDAIVEHARNDKPAVRRPVHHRACGLRSRCSAKSHARRVVRPRPLRARNRRLDTSRLSSDALGTVLPPLRSGPLHLHVRAPKQPGPSGAAGVSPGSPSRRRNHVPARRWAVTSSCAWVCWMGQCPRVDPRNRFDCRSLGPFCGAPERPSRQFSDQAMTRRPDSRDLRHRAEFAKAELASARKPVVQQQSSRKLAAGNERSEVFCGYPASRWGTNSSRTISNDSSARPAPLTHAANGSSQTRVSSWVSSLIRRARPRSFDPPPASAMPLERMSWASSGGACPTQSTTAPTIRSSGAAVRFSQVPRSNHDLLGEPRQQVPTTHFCLDSLVVA